VTSGRVDVQVESEALEAFLDAPAGNPGVADAGGAPGSPVGGP
jgi:hypothetical protein